MSVTITQGDFLNDKQGRRFAGIVHNHPVPFQDVLDFFNDPGRQRRMEESERWHKRPALAGVVIELEDTFNSYLSGSDAHDTQRWRQAIGVLCRIVMEHLGWRTTGRKGPLGRRLKNIAPHTTTPDAYVNTDESLSRYFTKAEHYEKRDA